MLEHAAPQTLAAAGVSVGYGSRLVLEQLDFSVERPSFTALVGPNGSGKSTLLRALARLISLRSGDVLLDGRSITQLPSRQLARRVAMLSQGPSAPEGMTVFDLVSQGRYSHRSIFSRWSPADDQACVAALNQTGAFELRGRRLDSLSGGQRQRAWISMVLAQQSEILLLDEPTTFLDLAHQIEVLELMRRLVSEQKKTIIAVLHDFNHAARYADRLALLKDGRLVAVGGPEELMNEAMIENVFGIACAIVRDPFTGKPLCVPATTRVRE